MEAEPGSAEVVAGKNENEKVVGDLKNTVAEQEKVIADLKRDPPKADRFGNEEEREWVSCGD